MIDANTEVVIDSKDIEVIIDKNVSLIDNNIDVETLEPEYEITVNRKEYTVVGDELYIPKRYEDAPQWLRDIIDNVTDVALSAKINDINNLTQSLNNLIVELEVAKNTYTQSIISSNDINERINTAIETLNSSVMESDATILGLATTRVTPEQAQAISIDAIRTSLNDTISGNSLGSIISEINAATTTGDYTNAQSIDVLQSTIEGVADSTATAIDTINTFAGIDEAGAYTYTGLTGYLVDPNTGMIGGGQSELQNTITTTGDNVEAKFEYGSNIKIGGKYHNAGFGLKTTMTGGDGTINDPYNSEFWINAEKFKFTNNAISGQVSPFSIDATGLQPKITFNGLVTFGSGQTGTIDEAINSKVSSATTDDIAKKLGYSSYADMVSKASLGQTITNGGYLRTSLIEANSIVANQINTTGLVADNIRSNTIIGNDIYGSKIEGVNIIGARINGAVIKASYLDLDGELEVLTNYHITLAMFNSNPSLYTDAVYISADNEYRIPSMSIVSEPPQTVSGTVGYSALNGKIMSYNNANSGTNIKAVKIRPTFNIISPIDLAIGTINSTINIYLGSNHLLRVIVDDVIANNNYDDSITANCYSSYWGTDEIRVRGYGSKSLSITGVPIFDFLVNISIVDGIRKFIISSNPKVSTIPFDWTSGSLVIESTGNIVTKTLGPQIQVNNMI